MRLVSCRIALLLVFVYLAACSSLPKVSPNLKAANAQQCVVLVHGLWRSGSAMEVIADDLSHFGYQTEIVDYPSTEATIPTLSRDYLQQSVENCRARGSEQIHMVSHSMGGILIRQYLQTHRLPEGSRVVMLSPPNQGSELSSYFADTWWYQHLVGPAGASLTKDGQGLIPSLKPIPEPVGIIAAYRNWSLWPDSWLPSPNDGTVSVRSMYLEEMDDFVLINAGHAMMRLKDETHGLIRQFLQYGQFDATEAIPQQQVVELSAELNPVSVPDQGI